ncbi:hypothetical protein DQ244_10170 [Blastococcus sp. TBT05-19]|uniref:hypothetical protein n=1 Tax=Blastococcus sp. TBT05-19 TaxID=2250581 RepID=UPI000DE81882|nr:hypothetical protein [Blastococcus sp. TBT05-19]RBY91662.1 hypothetical protein DQ244_10170 [Blastococcus sp. TBT05-19]
MSLDREQRRLRRAAIRRHHPDAGGSATDLLAALATFAGGRGGPATSSSQGAGPEVRFVRRPTGLQRLLLLVRTRSTRSSRPRRVV